VKANLRKQMQPVKYSKQADKFLDSLDKKTQNRIESAIDKIPDVKCKPYKSDPNSLLLRVGDFRIIFEWETNEQILVSKIDSRGQVYKRG
jgi:mRNA-degrading endonuclease RelE of RelBE toxin-antitoxin system